tara:strand:- start:1471 stop:3273 length:1803 start_codon:yes stop_codon:yes gene_type:complete
MSKNDNKKIMPIDYTHRDFESIRRDLVGIAERFYPDTFKDFSEGSFGSMMVDTVAYVADQLNFYLDYNVNEMFLDTSFQFSNILRHGRILGYKYTGRPSVYGEAAFFILVPASTTAMGPDVDYIPILKRGSTFKSQSGTTFILQENVDFNSPQNRVVTARVDTTTGSPSYFAIKAYGRVVSGQFKTETVQIKEYVRFLSLKLRSPNISEIISVVDSEGNEYFEVESLSQDLIYKEVSNKNYKNDNVPSILKPYMVSRKFVVEHTPTSTFLQFGSGKSGDSDVIANPQNVALDSFGKTYVSDTTFDPSALSKAETLGVVPVNTTLNIVYRSTDLSTSNTRTAALNIVANADLEFSDTGALATDKFNTVRGSLEVINESPITGQTTNLTSGEVKRRIFGTFATQNRAVTQADYENLVYRMPRKFGSISRCSSQRDPSSIKRNLNLYVISEDSFGNLITTNSTIKNNLKTWLSQYKMLNDTVDILDPYIINIGINFVVKSSASADRFELLSKCISKLTGFYTKEKFFIGEHLIISDIYQTLKDIDGVLDVVKVKYTNLSGVNYSGVEFDINQNTSPDGTHLVCPKNAVFEIKFPSNDIIGKVI